MGSGGEAAVPQRAPKTLRASARHPGSADRLFFLGDHQVEAVESLLRDVVVELCVIRFLDEAELGGLAGELVVLLGQLHLLHGLLDDGAELLGQRTGGGAAEVLRRRIVAAGEDALGVLHRHLLDRIDQHVSWLRARPPRRRGSWW